MKVMVLALALWGSAAAADDLVIDQTGFTGVQANEDITVNIEIGPDYSVTASTADGDITKLNVNRYDGWLVFSRDTRWLMFPNWRQDQFVVTVTTPILNEVKAFDGSDVTVTGGTLAVLRAEASNRGRLILNDLAVADLTLVSNENGILTASGSCERLTVAGDAEGTIDANRIDCGAAVVTKGSGVIAALPEGILVVEAHPTLGIN